VLKAKFICEKHQVDLTGEPIMLRQKGEDYFTLYFNHMKCPYPVDPNLSAVDLENCFIADWRVQFTV